MSFLFVLWSACLLDLFLGDPPWLPHPIRLIGRICETVENFTRQLPFSKKNMGRLTVVLVLASVGLGCGLIFSLSLFLSQLFFWLAALFLLYTTLAARDLICHAIRVHEALVTDLVEARQRVGMIVGRDTTELDEHEIIRACVESVAENMSDGIIAPLFWATCGAVTGLIFGGVWPVICAGTVAMAYKAVNTMDSMFGYKNDKYLEFGNCPAKLDDVLNYLPARISGIALVVAATMGGSMKQSLLILLRDRKKHASPNAGWPEAAAAGALGIQLGGESWYFGKLSRKPLLGDALRPPAAEDILRANRLVRDASILCLVLFSISYYCFVSVCTG